MEGNKTYKSCDISGKGKIHLHTHDKGEKFKVLQLSAEKVEISTAAEVKVSEIITLDIQLNGGLFAVNIDAVGKIVEKRSEGENIYVIEFIGMSDSDKEDINELMINTCNLD